jgi:hypothetical protein
VLLAPKALETKGDRASHFVGLIQHFFILADALINEIVSTTIE